jgi:hypothetical protein
LAIASVKPRNPNRHDGSRSGCIDSVSGHLPNGFRLFGEIAVPRRAFVDRFSQAIDSAKGTVLSDSVPRREEQPLALHPLLR